MLWSVFSFRLSCFFVCVCVCQAAPEPFLDVCGTPAPVDVEQEVGRICKKITECFGVFFLIFNGTCKPFFVIVDTI